MLTVTENMLRFNNAKYVEEHPLFFDGEYARALGYKDFIGMPGFSANDDVFMTKFPAEARDTLLVSQIDHSIECFRPVYPRDTIYMVRDRIESVDMTPPEGSIYRHIMQKNYGTTYNQHGEVVNKVCFTMMESVKVYRDECLPKPRNRLSFLDVWEAPDWGSRPLHYYSDEDWEWIRARWAEEPIRTTAGPKWSDIKVGEQLPLAVYGPIVEGVVPSMPYGMGVGGSRCLRKEIMDPDIFAELDRDEITGNYRSPNPEVNIPTSPDDAKPFFPPAPEGDDGPGEISTADIHKTASGRSALINFMGRDIALGSIINYFGDTAFVRRISWSIMCPETHALKGKPVVARSDFNIYSRRIPRMENATIPTHGLTYDLACVHSYIIEKAIVNGEPQVTLALWVAEISGEAWLTAEVVVALRE
ncbi:MAG: hypothetical protein ACOX1U_06530 [Saccharofermentanales bacterium]